MLISAATSTVLVNLTDSEGHLTGRSIPVDIEYVQTITQSYGEDADGRRGEPVIEYDFLGASMDVETLKTITIAQAEQAVAEARAIFHQRNRRTARRS